MARYEQSIDFSDVILLPGSDDNKIRLWDYVVVNGSPRNSVLKYKLQNNITLQLVFSKFFIFYKKNLFLKRLIGVGDSKYEPRTAQKFSE